MSDMLKYLEAIKNMTAKMKAPSIEAVVLQHGKSFTPPARPRPKGIRKGQNKMCYMNSYHLAISRNLVYVEGFAIFSADIPIPLHHAWVVDQQGEVIEPTWKTSGTEYYGIPLEMDFIHQVMLDTRRYGALDPHSPTFWKKYIAQ